MPMKCPHCGYSDFPGAVFCSECGSEMLYDDGVSTRSLADRLVDFEGISDVARSVTPETKPRGNEVLVSLYLSDSGQAIPLRGKIEFTLGRGTSGGLVTPDIDLNKYQALANGVSRMHASVKFVDNKIYIVDLGSSNGTRVNGKKVSPESAKQLHNGDFVALGKLKMQIMVNGEGQ